jgi:DNA-binding cell septation regulator SpoVG
MRPPDSRIPGPPGSGGPRRTAGEKGDDGYHTRLARSPQASSAIEVVALKRVEGYGNVRAFVDVQLGGVTIHGCKVVQQEGQRAWLAPPQREWTGDDGKRRWSNVVELSKELYRKASEAVLAAWERGQ